MARTWPRSSKSSGSPKRSDPFSLVPKLRLGTHLPKLRFASVSGRNPKSRRAPGTKRSFDHVRSQAELGNEVLMARLTPGERIDHCQLPTVNCHFSPFA